MRATQFTKSCHLEVPLVKKRPLGLLVLSTHILYLILPLSLLPSLLMNFTYRDVGLNLVHLMMRRMKRKI